MVVPKAVDGCDSAEDLLREWYQHLTSQRLWLGTLGRCWTLRARMHREEYRLAGASLSYASVSQRNLHVSEYCIVSRKVDSQMMEVI